MKATGFSVVALVALGTAVAQSFGRFTYSVVLPAARDDLGISNTVAGSIGTANVTAYLLGTVAVAALSGRYRLIDIMRVGFVFSVIGLSLASFAVNAPMMAIAMLSAGFGGACIWIPAPVIASDAVAPTHRALAVGLMGSGIGLGVVFSSQLAAYVRATAGDSAWRNVYRVEAVIGIIMLVLIFALVRHHQERPTGAGLARLGGFDVLRTMRGWIPITIAYAAFGFMYLLIIQFLSAKLEGDNGWSAPDASLAFTILGVAVIFGGPMMVALAQRFGVHRAMPVAFLAWALLVLLVLPGWPVPSLFAAAGIGFAFSGVPSMITMYVVDNTTTRSYGPSFSAATLAFGVAQLASPQVGGAVADLTGSFTPVFLLSVAMAGIGMIAALRVPKPAN